MKQTIFIQGNKITFDLLPFKNNLKPIEHSLKYPKEFILKYIDLSDVQYDFLESGNPGIGEQIIRIFYKKHSLNDPSFFMECLQEYQDWTNRVCWVFIQHLMNNGNFNYEDLIDKTEKEILFLTINAMKNEDIQFIDQEKFNLYKEMLITMYGEEIAELFLSITNPRIGSVKYKMTPEEIDEINMKEIASLGE